MWKSCGKKALTEGGEDDMMTELSKNGERWKKDREIKKKKVLDKKIADVII